MVKADSLSRQNPAKWQQERRRDNLTFTIAPAQGFGPDGTFTMWIPDATTRKRWTFKDGKPVEGKVDGIMADPEMRRFRDEIVRSFEPGRLDSLIRVDAIFVDYAARMLTSVYRLTDEELEFLLSGDKWHKAILTHVLGGDEMVDKLADANPLLNLLVRPPEPDVEIDPNRGPDPWPLPPPSRWERIKRWFLRR